MKARFVCLCTFEFTLQTETFPVTFIQVFHRLNVSEEGQGGNTKTSVE